MQITIIVIMLTLSSSCELGTCRASLVFPEQSILKVLVMHA